MLTFEGQQFMGVANISQKMAVCTWLLAHVGFGPNPVALPFMHLLIILLRRWQSLGKLAHNVQRFDVQPSTDPNNLVIVVIGQVKVSRVVCWGLLD